MAHSMAIKSSRVVKPAAVNAHGAVVPRPLQRIRTLVPRFISRGSYRIPSVSDQVADAGSPTSGGAALDNNWVPVCKPEDLPKGVRKEVEVDGVPVLMFWYRNEIFAIETRSPAEGAYSEGFVKAKFTQDYCIECPSTASLFSLKDGSIQSWYPNNAVLGALTSRELCRPMEIYSVKLTQEAIYVNVTISGSTGAAVRSGLGRGGAGTSLEDNNVFTVQPTVYFEGQDPRVESASVYSSGPSTPLNPVTVILAIVAVGIIAIVGTATAIYLEDIVLGIAFWSLLGGGAALYAYNYLKNKEGTA